MKKALLPILTILGCITLVGCGTGDSTFTSENNDDQNTSERPNSGAGNVSSTTGDFAGGSSDVAANVIVVYFSATNHTEAVAQTIADHIDSAIYELEPVNPYTSADLNYGNSSSRVVQEYEMTQQGQRVNVELETTDFDGFDDANYVFLGAPVWWQKLSWVIEDFVASNDFSNKTIIPFGTSASSGYTLGNLTPLTEDDENVTWLDPQRFRSNVSGDDVIEWVDSLGFTFE